MQGLVTREVLGHDRDMLDGKSHLVEPMHGLFSLCHRIVHANNAACSHVLLLRIRVDASSWRIAHLSHARAGSSRTLATCTRHTHAERCQGRLRLRELQHGLPMLSPGKW